MITAAGDQAGLLTRTPTDDQAMAVAACPVGGLVTAGTRSCAGRAKKKSAGTKKK